MQETEVFSILSRTKCNYIITGSIASICYGEPRLTRDVDIVVDCNESDLMDFLSLFPEESFYKSPPEVVKAELARPERGHTNIIEHSTGFKVDVYFCGENALSAWALENSVVEEIAGFSLKVAPAEYVILNKLIYFRESGSDKHIRDIRGIIAISESRINFETINMWLSKLGLEEVWKTQIEN